MLKYKANKAAKRFAGIFLSMLLLCAVVPFDAMAAYAGESATGVSTTGEFTAALANSDSIILNADIVAGAQTFIDHSLTIDLNGHTLTFGSNNDYGFFVYNNATLNIVGDGAIDSCYCVFYLGYTTNNDGYVSLGTDGSEISLTTTDDIMVYLNYNSKLTVGSEVAMHQKTSEKAGIAIFNDADLDFSGSIIADDGFAITTNGTATTNSNVTIRNGAVVTATDENVAIYQASGTYILEGGTITGGTGLYMRSGSLTVPASSSAIINGTYDVGENNSTGSASGGAYTTGDALVIDNSDYPAGAPVVSILGGTFYSEYGSPVSSIATVTGQTPIAHFINGGRFSDIPESDHLVAGATVSVDPNNSSYYIVTPAAVQ